MASSHILIVDDDPVFTQFTQNLLTEKGMRVSTAFNKAEAIEFLDKQVFSCAIFDIFLPDGSGVDLIKPLRSNGTGTPIIMVSGQGDVEEVVRAMKDGANDYIKKPFRGEELILKIQMVLENTQAKWELEELKSKVRSEDEYKLLFSLSDRMRKVQAIVDQVANTDITILITGESGTGKELVAKALHKASERANEPFIKVNCRILTATNKNLEKMVEENRFRRDLFYRINVVNIPLPPLRERKDDIPLLVEYFLKRYSEMYNREYVKISPRLMEMFLNYSWQGNVRELENNIKRFVILGSEAQLIAEFLRKRENGAYSNVSEEGSWQERDPDRRPEKNNHRSRTMQGNGDAEGDFPMPDKGTLKEVSKIAQRKAEKEMIGRVLQQTRWNRRKAAEVLDISYKALLYKIKECGLNQE